MKQPLDRDKTAVAEPLPPAETSSKQQDEPRGAIAEWAITILLLLFVTTTLVQAYVIPTGSMEDTLLIGDHLLVDKLAFAPGGPVSKYLLPYSDVKRGDIIVFRYPVDITQTFVKRAMGVPGDRIRIVNKAGLPQRREARRTLRSITRIRIIDPYRDNFPGPSPTPCCIGRRGHAAEPRREWRSGGSPGQLFRHG